MRTHVQRTVSQCFAVLRQLRQIRHSVPTDTFQTLVVSLVLTRLVYETVSWLAFRSTWSDDSSQCWTQLHGWPTTCGDPTTSPMCWPASIGRENRVQDRRLDIQSHSRTCAGVPRPFHMCRQSTHSTIAAFCQHQSPGSAYQQTVDCW